MPSVSKKQARTMAGVAHSASFAKKMGIPQSVGKEFNQADKGTGILKKEREDVDEAEGILKCLNCGHAAVIHGQNDWDGSTGIGDSCRALPKCDCPGLKLPGQRMPVPVDWQKKEATERIVSRLLAEAQKLSFEEWLKQVDDAVWKRGGMSIHDLPDVPLRDWYDSGTSPVGAANRALRAAKSGE